MYCREEDSVIDWQADISTIAITPDGIEVADKQGRYFGWDS